MSLTSEVPVRHHTHLTGEETQSTSVKVQRLQGFTEFKGTQVSSYNIIKKLKQKYPITKNVFIKLLRGRTCLSLKNIQPVFYKVNDIVQLIKLKIIISCRQLIWGFILHAYNLSETIINMTRFQRRCSLLHGPVVFVTGLNVLIRLSDNANGSSTS